MGHLIQFAILFAIVTCALASIAPHRLRRQIHASVISSTSPPKLSAYRNLAGGSIEEKFQINKNSIIRTHDSRALGAKYLNETDLASNDECLRWCWNTSNCNLAVYEEKTRGSCYLFDCGPRDDFKCRFTGHSFYSSSVLQVNRNSYFLNEWKSQTNQENELTGLKTVQQSKTAVEAMSGQLKSIRSSEAKDAAPPTTATKVSHCRHYQFECRNNSECIAIYNVCDGIPQCSDASDEAVELECHKSRLISPKPPGETVSEVVTKSSVIVLQKVIPGQIANTYNANSVFAGNGKAPVDVAVSNEPGKLLNYQPSTYLTYNYPRSPNDKILEDNLLYSNRAQLGADYSTANNERYGLSNWNQYSLPADIYKTDKLTFGSEPDQYGGVPLKESLSYWPSFNYQTNGELQSLQHSGHQQQDIPYSGLAPLSITESRNRPTEFQAANHQQSAAGQSPIYNRFFGNSVPFVSKTEPSNGTIVKEQAKAVTGDLGQPGRKQAANLPPKVDYSHISSSQKQIPVAAPAIVAVSHLRDSSPQSGRETNSAVIALTLGLFVTCILVVIVGCRMKSFKKRIARRGRSLTHDADYLVNGMYL